jgi:hypothetical protein
MVPSEGLPSPLQTYLSTVAVAHAMTGNCYAINGGAACTVLGSSRLTSDVDFPVQGYTKRVGF